MFLADLQKRLERQYDLSIPYCIEQFVSSDRALADRLADDQAGAGQQRPDVEDEVVFIQQHNDTLEFTVYVDQALLDAVDDSRSDLDGLCTVVEGVSHGVCLLWHAHHDRQIRPIDLELQAEIDKFIVLAEHQPECSQRKQLHRQLFANSRLVAPHDPALCDRYMTASKLASRYCHWLDRHFIRKDDQVALHQELARFYRLSGRGKFEHIEQLH